MNLEQRLQQLRELAETYAKAQAERVYLEEFRKSKLAILQKAYAMDGFETLAAQEREARADKDYLKVLQGLKEATEAAEKARWELEIARVGASLYQTRQADQRAERRAYGA